MQDGAVAGFKYFDLTETRRIRIEISGNGKGYMEVMSGPDGSVCCRIPADTGNPAVVMESELNLHLQEREASISIHLNWKADIALTGFRRPSDVFTVPGFYFLTCIGWVRCRIHF